MDGGTHTATAHTQRQHTHSDSTHTAKAHSAAHTAQHTHSDTHSTARTQRQHTHSDTQRQHTATAHTQRHTATHSDSTHTAHSDSAKRQCKATVHSDSTHTVTYSDNTGDNTHAQHTANTNTYTTLHTLHTCCRSGTFAVADCRCCGYPIARRPAPGWSTRRLLLALPFCWPGAARGGRDLYYETRAFAVIHSASIQPLSPIWEDRISPPSPHLVPPSASPVYDPATHNSGSDIHPSIRTNFRIQCSPHI